MNKGLQFITLRDNTGRATSLSFGGREDNQRLTVVGVLPHYCQVEPDSIEDADKWINWLQEWKKRKEDRTWKAKIAEQFGLTEDRFFNHYSDLYIGCDNYEQANKIKNGGPWRSMASIFYPQSGSDMGKFPVAVDIPFGCLSEFIQAKAK